LFLFGFLIHAQTAEIIAVGGQDTAPEDDGIALQWELRIRNGIPDEEIFVTIAITGTATEGNDYPLTLRTYPVQLDSGGDADFPIEVTAIADNIVELDETIIGQITNITSSISIIFSTATATLTIENDDNAEVTIGDAQVIENIAGGNLIFTVTLDRVVPGGTQIAYSFSDDTATGGGVDYDSTGGTITFLGLANETQNIVVPIINDGTVEIEETFMVQLDTPSNNAELADGGEAIGTIQNDDTATISITNTSSLERSESNFNNS